MVGVDAHGFQQAKAEGLYCSILLGFALNVPMPSSGSARPDPTAFPQFLSQAACTA